MILKSEIRSRKCEVRSLIPIAIGTEVRSTKYEVLGEVSLIDGDNQASKLISDSYLHSLRPQTSDLRLRMPCFFICLLLFSLTGCYSFKDISIPPEVKTCKVNYLENKARYINPQLSPQLTDKLRQKINNQTRLTQVQSDDAHYDISGWVSGYDLSTSGISGKQASTNRLIVTVHIIFKNRLDEKKNFEEDVSRNFDFSAGKSFDEAQRELVPSIIQNMVDEIFNRIFSNW